MRTLSLLGGIKLDGQIKVIRCANETDSLQQALIYYKKHNTDNYKSPLTAIYENMPATVAGGVKKQFATLCFEQICREGTKCRSRFQSHL